MLFPAATITPASTPSTPGWNLPLLQIVLRIQTSEKDVVRRNALLPAGLRDSDRERREGGICRGEEARGSTGGNHDTELQGWALVGAGRLDGKLLGRAGARVPSKHRIVRQNLAGRFAKASLGDYLVLTGYFRVAMDWGLSI